MRKNVAGQAIGAQMVNATTGAPFTGAVTVAVTGDNGTQATGSVGAGACTHEGNGYHSYAPAQGETNYNHVAYTFTGTGAIPVTTQIFTDQSFDRLGAPEGTSISADIAAALASLLSAAGQIASGTLQSATSTTAQLASATSFADDLVIGATLIVTGGTGVGQARQITDWVSATDTATVATWTTTPDNTSTYRLIATSPTGGSGVVTSIAANALTAASIAADAITEIQAGLATASALATVDTVVDAILVDTATTVPALIAALDVLVAAVKAKTDSLTFTQAGHVDANMQRINDVAVTGNGSGSPFSV